jgi:hypothetical protein
MSCWLWIKLSPLGSFCYFITQIQLQHRLEHLIVAFKVDVVFVGHVHKYEHTAHVYVTNFPKNLISCNYSSLQICKPSMLGLLNLIITIVLSSIKLFMSLFTNCFGGCVGANILFPIFYTILQMDCVSFDETQICNNLHCDRWWL